MYELKDLIYVWPLQKNVPFPTTLPLVAEGDDAVSLHQLPTVSGITTLPFGTLGGIRPSA
jgi:hypothetical protein